MKILHGYVEPKPEAKAPTLHYGVMEGKADFWRHVGPAHDTLEQARAYVDGLDTTHTGFSHRITRIWRIYE